MYNNQYQGGQYGQPAMPPGYGGFGGPQGAPPGMGPPPGMAAPGMSAPGVGPPPGIVQNNAQPASRPGGVPSSFQAPPNMPNINFSAPVIRLGTTGPPKPATPIGGEAGRKSSIAEGGYDRPQRAGVGAEPSMNQQRQAMRDSMAALVPPTRDEVIRTVFVGKIPEGAGGDEGIERILRSAGYLKKWSRATDADGKQCTFGFGEYEDMESLGTAVEILKEVEVPIKKQVPKEKEDVKREDVDDAVMEDEVDKTTLLIITDENSLDYLESYRASREDEPPSIAQARLDNARASLAAVLEDLAHPRVHSDQAADQDANMHDVNGKAHGQNAEIVTIALTVDDELADIPAEMRATVAEEIAAFRDRSIRRDMERLKREEEIEQQERARSTASRINRLASPPTTAPLGPAGGSNGVPLGPRSSGIPGAPSGPKGYHGAQLPKEYQKGVAFVNGSGINGAAAAGWINRDEEDDSASDEELEQRRKEKSLAQQEKMYLDHERRWINREKSRNAALEREKQRDIEEDSQLEIDRAAMAKRFSQWDDEIEASRKIEDYYRDRNSWIRNRASFRAREMEADDRDRQMEEREKSKEMHQKEHARGMADQFLARAAEEIDITPREPQRFKLSLGAAAQKAQAAANPKRTVAEVEGLLEDEEDGDAAGKRTLIPIKFDSAAEARGLSDEEREQAVRQLAAEIPSEKDGLWSWPVQWDFVDEAVISEKLKPFVERKIVEYLGVQEQLLVELVEEHIRKRGGPQDLTEQLEGALDEEAEVLVKKLWRMVIFFSESEKKGLSS